MHALALFSGGLDSMLAIKLMREQDIQVTALHFNIGFGSTKDRSDHLAFMARQVDAELKIVDIRKQFVDEVLFDPKYGYGSDFNPCIDCHANMFRHAFSMLEPLNARFVISGEVVGERPMSQRVQALKIVEKLSGGHGLILRPLSAKRLAPTIPEENGWVDRERLLDIQGRNRSIQLAMAEQYGFIDFEKPGGGCLLTDPNFGTKMKEHIAHDTFGVEDILPMKFGRHFRLPDGAKLIVGRHADDNQYLQKSNTPKLVPVLLPDDIIGPFSLISADASPKDKLLAARIILTYARTDKETHYRVTVAGESTETIPFATKEACHAYFI